ANLDGGEGAHVGDDEEVGRADQVPLRAGDRIGQEARVVGPLEGERRDEPGVDDVVDLAERLVDPLVVHSGRELGVAAGDEGGEHVRVAPPEIQVDAVLGEVVADRGGG